MTYPIGTRVRLKSGGPVMVVVDGKFLRGVSGMRGFESATCAWRNENGNVSEYAFPVECLKAAG